MKAYDASVCEKIAEYRRLDRPIFENLKQRLVSRGMNENLAGQAILAWGKSRTSNVTGDLETGIANGWDSEERYASGQKPYDTEAKMQKSSSSQSTGLKALGEVAKGVAVQYLTEKLGLPNNEYGERSIISVNHSPVVMNGNVRPIEIAQKSGTRPCDLEWLFDYAIKRMGTNSFFNSRQFFDGIDIQNERFQDASAFYDIARGKLDALQGKNTPEAFMTAQMYLDQELSPIHSPEEVDDGTREKYVNYAKKRFEFDKPKGFIPPTDEEMRDYARQLSHNLVSYKPLTEEVPNF